MYAHEVRKFEIDTLGYCDQVEVVRGRLVGAKGFGAAAQLWPMGIGFSGPIRSTLCSRLMMNR